ncbi:transposable element Tcb2 transposase [Trichonephila clavipes]|nr:transposable element Tcb2 transposase [Trichonephila clavipes]
MDPTCQQETVQAGRGSVMVWGMCSWRDMEPPIRLDTTPTGDSVQLQQKRLQEYSSEFRHFRWPPKFQDMTIIEHIWDALQRAVRKRFSPPLTSTDLWTDSLNRISATSCCGTSAFSLEPYPILGRRKTDFFPEDTTKSYSGFEPTRLQAEGHSHHTGWATSMVQ